MGLLDGKVGLVVGIANNRSYAFHIAKSLIEHGATCAFTHLPGEKNERRTRKAVEEIGVPDPLLIPLEASSDEQIADAVDAYGSKHDKMDFLIHSIAFADRDWLQFGKFVETPREAYMSAVDISAYTLLGLTRASGDLLKASGSASVLAMSYYGAEKVVPGYNVMGVAKAALECTMRYLAAELGQYNIRVNTISGGYLRTLAASAVAGTGDMEKHNLDRAPLRRNVEGDDVGGTATWLVSELSKGVTGENIYVDCGVSTIGA